MHAFKQPKLSFSFSVVAFHALFHFPNTACITTYTLLASMPWLSKSLSAVYETEVGHDHAATASKYRKPSKYTEVAWRQEVVSELSGARGHGDGRCWWVRTKVGTARA
jgi:hypothetical protein